MHVVQSPFEVVLRGNWGVSFSQKIIAGRVGALQTVVEEVAEGSAAAGAGVKPGDILHRVGQVDVANSNKVRCGARVLTRVLVCCAMRPCCVALRLRRRTRKIRARKSSWASS